MGLFDYTEDLLIEQPTVAFMSALGWQIIHCCHETFPANLFRIELGTKGGAET